MAELKTVHVRNISYKGTNQQLGDYFAKFGTVASARIIVDRYRGDIISKGFGFVEFAEEKGAKAAIDFQDHTFMDRKLFVSQARPKRIRVRDTAFISGIPAGTKDEDIKAAFAGYNVINVKVVKYDIEGKRGFGFVQFGSEQEQTKAVKENRSVKVNGTETIVRFARQQFNEKPRRFRRRFSPNRRAQKE